MKRKADTEFKLDTESLREYIETMPAVVYEYCQHADGGGELIYVSPNCLEIFGYPAEYFVGDTNHFWERIHPEDRHRLKAEDMAPLRDSSFTSDVRIRTRTGEEKWIRLLSRPLEKKSGEDFISWIGSIIDITERRLAQIRRDELIDDLKQALEEIKSRDLHLRRTNEALEKARVNLETKNKQLDQFAQVVAHDLNSVINNIVGASSILMESALAGMEEDDRDLMKQIYINSLKMGDVIKELLAFSTIGKASVEINPICMDEVFRSAKNRLAQVIKETSATINVNHLSERALGHGPWIEEVWYNILSNAIKYGGDPPVISVGSNDTGDMVTFWVEDNGQGLTRRDLATIFDSKDNTSMRIIKGHGLGLGIVRQIVEELGGEVDATSQPGKGSRFMFSLPASRK